MKIVVLQPTYRLIPTESYQCMINLLYRSFQKGDLIQYAIADSIKIDHVRNYLTQKFLEVDAEFDYIMWIDSDQVFNPEQVYMLIEKMEKNNLDIVSGKYYKRRARVTETCAFEEIGDEYLAVIPESKGLQEVDAVGFGFVLMRPDVLKKMQATYGQRQFEFQYLEDGIDFLGEDMTWCRRAKNIGYKIWLDNDCVIGHWGATI